MSPSHAVKPISRLGWFIILVLSLALPQASLAAPAPATDAPAALTYTWTATWTSPGAPFREPNRLAAAPDGSFYALETGRNQLRHIGPNGELLAMLSPAPGQGNLVTPKALAVDALERLYVLESWDWPAEKARIVRYANDRFDTVIIPWWASYIYGPGHGLRAIGVTGDAIVLGAGPVIVRFDLAGRRIGQSYPEHWEYPAGTQFNSFRDLALDADGRIYRLHSDEGNDGIPPVQIVDALGNELGRWGINRGDKAGPALGPGVFIQPSDIATDLRGHVFVVDTQQSSAVTNPVGSCRVQVFDESGAYLTEFGGCGSENGKFLNPQSIIALADGRVVVADTGNDRLQVFTPSELPALRPLPGPAAWDTPVAARPGTWEDWGPRGVGRIDTILLPPQPSADRPIIGLYGERGFATSLDGAIWERRGDSWPGHDRNWWQPWSWADKIRYAGSRTLLATGPQEDAGYRSEDFGRTWIRLGDAPGKSPRYIAASPTFDADRTLFLATEDGRVWHSTDAGDTWELRSKVAERISDLEALPGPNASIVLLVSGGMGVYDGILRSLDGGATWTGEWPADARGRQFFASPTFAQDQTVFVGPWMASANANFLRSVDGGATWSEVPMGSNSAPMSIAFSPNYATDRTLLVWNEMSQSYLSTDGGDTWKPFDSGPLSNQSEPSLKWLAFSPNYGADGAIWRQRESGAGIEVTTDRGATWQPLGAAPGDLIRALAAPLEAAPPWAATRNAVVSLTGAAGSATPLYPLTYEQGRRSPIAFSPAYVTDKTAIAGGAITRDAGATWQPLPFAASLRQAESAVAAFAPDYPSGRRILVAYDFAPLDYHSGVQWTADDGATWQIVRVPVAAIRGLVFDTANPLRVYAAGEGGVAASTDGGQSWENVGGPLRFLRVTGLVARKEGGKNILYAATSHAGMWKSDDGGATWTQMNGGLADGYLCALSGNANMLTAATCAGQLYLSSAPFAGWEPVGEALPGEPTDLLAQGSRFAGRMIAGTTIGAFNLPQAVANPLRLWLPVVK